MARNPTATAAKDRREPSVLRCVVEVERSAPASRSPLDGTAGGDVKFGSPPETSVRAGNTGALAWLAGGVTANGLAALLRGI
jgi:hypothetical protein